MRSSLRRGGELLDLAHRERKRQKLKLVLLCDVGKSMDLYSLLDSVSVCFPECVPPD